MPAGSGCGTDDSSANLAAANPKSSMCLSDDEDLVDSKLGKTYSYTYWKREGDDHRQRAPAPPPPLMVATTPSSGESGVGSGGVGGANGAKLQRLSTAPSPWNHAGTWEERDVSADLKTWLPKLFSQFIKEQSVKGVYSVDAVSGKGSICFVRGRPKLGFELKYAFHAGDKDVEVSEFADDDDGMLVVPQQTGEAAQILQQFRSSLSALFVKMQEETWLATN